MLNEGKILRPGRGRCQGPEAEAKALRSRPRQFSEVKVKAEANGKVMNKKYQMMTDNIQLSLIKIVIKTTHFNF